MNMNTRIDLGPDSTDWADGIHGGYNDSRIHLKHSSSEYLNDENFTCLSLSR